MQVEELLNVINDTAANVHHKIDGIASSSEELRQATAQISQSCHY